MTKFTLLLASLFFLQSAPLRGDDEPRKFPELTKEERAKRADQMDKAAEMHKAMAACLRSDKPLAECHEQMRKECPMGKDECPMWGDWHGRKHGHHGKRMNKKAPSAEGEKE